MAITVIIGAPCAGKSTYARESMASGDVVVDYDELAKAFGSDKPHESYGAVRTVALAARREAIRSILRGVEANAFIIHTNPTKEQVDDYIKADAQFVFLDPSKETCLARAEQRPATTAAAIEDWYANQPEVIQRLSLSPNQDEMAKLLAGLELRELSKTLSKHLI